MFWKSVLISTILGAQALVEAQQAVTVTQTVYESNQCLENYAKKILQNNPTGLTTGIPVVIVYEPKTEQAGQQQQQQQQGNKPQSTTKKNPNTVAAESQITTVLETRVCQKNGCQVHTYTTAIAAQNSYTTEITATATEDPTFRTTSVKTAETTTSIIFSATTLPKSTFIPSTSNTISRTSIVNPVSSQSVVSASKSVTIDTSTITAAITIGDESTVVKPSNSTTSHSNSLNGSANSESTTKSNSRLTNASTSSLSSTSRVTSSARTSDPSSSSLGSSDIIDSIDPTFSSVYESTSSSGYLNSTTVESSTESESSLVKSSSLESISSETSSDFASSTSSEEASSSSLSSESSESLAPSSSSASETESETESSSSTEESSEPTIEPKVCYTGDLFRAVDTSAPPSVFTRDQLPLSIPSGVDNNGKPIGTNKFYTNLVINDQNLMVYPLPYALYWSKSTYYGFGVQHINLDQRVFGSQNTNNVGVASYYYDPTNNGEIIFSATSFSESANYMRVTDMTDLSALVTLSSTSNDDTNYLNIPLVQGMGFATAIYNGNLTPLLNSLYGVKELSLETSDALSSNVIKYRATLLNNIEWLIYVTLPTADTEFELEVQDYYNIVGSNSVDGLIIQVAIAPTDEDQDLYYDAAAGTYVTSASVLGNVVCDTDATYRITYQSQGNSSSGSPLVFALPHHLDSLTGDVLDAATGILVPSTTKGNMTGFLTDEFVFSETIQQEVEFLPWLPSLNGPLTYTQDQLTLLASAANHELAVNIRSSVANMDSNYFSGKVIDKYAQILLVVSEIIQDENVTSDALAAMKDAFDVFLENEQYYPLMYDTKFGGVTSTSAQGGDTGADFGAAYYNDHDFHYGYFIHAAAVVGYVDQKLNGTWAEDNKDWVNSLIRDTSNPSADDTYFPISRTFDWYAGHSWATGLFTTYKNIESSSEALHHAAALKLWGKVIGDHSLESRGGLILAIMNRSYNDYFYYKRDNAVEPEQILPNKVSGIFFENKVDYTTFFGAPDEYPQYVHGIHMLPITPSSALARVPSYVQEEWDDQVVSFISNVSDGWLGILRLNQAIIDPRTSYDFFASDDWSDNYLDNGQSRTWSLAFSGIYNSL